MSITEKFEDHVAVARTTGSLPCHRKGQKVARRPSPASGGVDFAEEVGRLTAVDGDAAPEVLKRLVREGRVTPKPIAT
jgi:hypothetical protein